MQTSPSLELREGENAGSIGENVILKFINLTTGTASAPSALCPHTLHCSIAGTRLIASLSTLWTTGGRLNVSTAPLNTFSSSTRTPLPPTTGQYQLQTRTPHDKKKQDGIATCSAVLFSENPNQNPVQRKTGKAGWSLS